MAVPIDSTLFREIVASSLVGVWVLDPHGVTVYVNDAMATMLGFDRAEMLGQHLERFMPVAAAAAQFLERRRAGVREHSRVTLVHRHGHMLWVDMAATSRVGPDGGHGGSAMIVRDVTDFHRFQEERERLLDEVTIVADVVDRSPVAIQVYDGHGVLQRMNEAARLLHGLPRSRFAVGEANGLVDPIAQASGLSERLRPGFEGRSARHEWSFDYETLDEAGGRTGTVCIEQTVYPLLRPDGSVLAVVSIAQEITERKRVEAALVDTERIASLGVMAGRVAHDFNNLLAGVLGHVDLLIDQPRVPEPALLHIERIADLARRGTELTRPLLSFAGGESLRPVACDLNELVRDAVDMARVRLARAGIVELHLGTTPLPVRVDRDQISRVVTNLLCNALDATPEHGRIRIHTGTVEVGAPTDWRGRVSPGRHAYLEVEDSGSGIEAGLVARIFEPYFTTRRHRQGLGLSATLGIVSNHTGGIQVVSTPAFGARFTVALPLQEPQPQPSAPAGPPTGAGAALRPVALCADDDETVREVLGRMIELSGFEVVGARDGQEAWELYSQAPGRFAIVVLDLLMPRLGGAEVYARLRSHAPHLPVLLCSGYAHTDIRVPPPEDAHARFLAKPFRLAELKQTLAALVGERRS